MLPLTRLAFRLLAESQLYPLINDKEFGFTLVHVSVVQSIHLRVLQSKSYEEVDPDTLAVDYLCGQYRKICLKIAQCLKQEGLYRQLVKSTGVGGATLSAKLMCNIKTHKGPGCIGFRNLHAAPRGLFSGLVA